MRAEQDASQRRTQNRRKTQDKTQAKRRKRAAADSTSTTRNGNARTAHASPRLRFDRMRASALIRARNGGTRSRTSPLDRTVCLLGIGGWKPHPRRLTRFKLMPKSLLITYRAKRTNDVMTTADNGLWAWLLTSTRRSQPHRVLTCVKCCPKHIGHTPAHAPHWSHFQDMIPEGMTDRRSLRVPIGAQL